MKKLFKIKAAKMLALCLLSSCSIYTMGNKDWDNKNTATHSLGASLENSFYTFVNGCSIVQADSNKTSIPKNLSDVLNLSDIVFSYDMNGSGLLFSHIFESPELIPFDNGEPAGGQKRILSYLNTTDIPYKLLSNVTYTGYSHTCSSYLSAAARAELKVPYSSVEKSLSGEQNQVSRIVLVSGTFISPLHEALTSYGPKTTRAYLEIWDKYNKGNLDPSKKYYYLQNFSALTTIFTKDLARTGAFKLDGGAGGSFTFGSAELASKARFEESSKLDITDYRTYVRLTPPAGAAVPGGEWFDKEYVKDNYFSDLPTKDKIKDYFSKSVYPKLVSSETLKQGVQSTFDYVVEGIPNTYCQNIWTADWGDLSKILDLQPLFVSPVINKENECNFRVQGTPKDTFINQPSDPTSKSFKFKLGDLELTASGNYNVVSDPNFIPAPDNKYIDPRRDIVAGSNGANFIPVWNAQIEFDGGTNPIAYDKVGDKSKLVAQPKIVCDGNISPEVTGEITGVDGRNKILVEIKLKDPAGLKTSDYAPPSSSGLRCKGTASISLPLTKTANLISRNITFNLLWPLRIVENTNIDPNAIVKP